MMDDPIADEMYERDLNDRFRELEDRLEVLEAAEKKRSDREDQALRALRQGSSEWLNERNT